MSTFEIIFLISYAVVVAIYLYWTQRLEKQLKKKMRKLKRKLKVKKKKKKKFAFSDSKGYD